METQQMLDAVLSAHKMIVRTQCGAISIPVVHHHGSESDKHSGPKRTLRCTKDAGHEGPHKDAICCYSFQEFEDWQVKDRQPKASDVCSCGSMWPCPTIKAIQDQMGAEFEETEDR